MGVLKKPRFLYVRRRWQKRKTSQDSHLSACLSPGCIRKREAIEQQPSLLFPLPSPANIISALNLRLRHMCEVEDRKRGQKTTKKTMAVTTTMGVDLGFSWGVSF